MIWSVTQPIKSNISIALWKLLLIFRRNWSRKATTAASAELDDLYK